MSWVKEAMGTCVQCGFRNSFGHLLRNPDGSTFWFCDFDCLSHWLEARRLFHESNMKRDIEQMARDNGGRHG
jgi:hypothetical protein